MVPVGFYMERRSYCLFLTFPERRGHNHIGLHREAPGWSGGRSRSGGRARLEAWLGVFEGMSKARKNKRLIRFGQLE